MCCHCGRSWVVLLLSLRAVSGRHGRRGRPGARGDLGVRLLGRERARTYTRIHTYKHVLSLSLSFTEAQPPRIPVRTYPRRAAHALRLVTWHALRLVTWHACCCTARKALYLDADALLVWTGSLFLQTGGFFVHMGALPLYLRMPASKGACTHHIRCTHRAAVH